MQYLTSDCSRVDGKHYRTFEEYCKYSSNSKNDYTLWYESDYQIKKWAGPLRKVASILLGMDEQYLYTREFKESILPECWWFWDDGCSTEPYIGGNTKNLYEYNTVLTPTNGRLFLQMLGTNAMRDGLHVNTWVNALISEYRPEKMSEYNPSKWIISDTRFLNELQAVRDRNGITIKVERPSLVSTDNHPSETSLDHITDWDYIITNDSSIEDLIEKVRVILQTEGIL